MKKNSGITLVELVVVLAVIAIISAIVVPNFFGMTEGARLRADIQSTIVLRNAFELYRLQNPGSNYNDIVTILNELYRRDFLSSQLIEPQTDDAYWQVLGNNIILNIPLDIYNSHGNILTSQELAVTNR